MSNTTVWHCLVIVGQNEDIPDLLQNAEPTAELYNCLLSYIPSQNHSAYEWPDFGSSFLLAINRMVSVIFTRWHVRGVMYLFYYIGFWWWQESLQQTSEYHCTLCPQELPQEPWTSPNNTWCVPNYGSVSFWGRNRSWIGERCSDANSCEKAERCCLRQRQRRIRVVEKQEGERGAV